MKIINLKVSEDIFNKVLNFLELLPKEKVHLDVLQEEYVVATDEDTEAYEEAVADQINCKTISWREYAKKKNIKTNV
ncbi:MAG: hypothetical protein NUV76_00715 [Candidatus Kuenenia sp.]|nr:hypothetical protein [Candidatus Kuenenia sp.]